ncbi:peroxiredoxin [Deinococcus sp. Leaf326]|uniref:peroxiredoxin n=1 Tax=Deinococcus sp. Leaf326 TaxID=1736338 RepID=UPI0006F2AEC0|nr:peroxiredoxin [Deinococcus sp. Leaf326]KQR40959.1 alkyl hydroperoxide reductase [Deinococcus sp. Leaf326]
MAPRVGQPAPPFEARSDNGQLLSLAALRGQWIVLTFWPGAQCPACAEAQALDRLQPEFAALGAAVIAVSRDTEAHLAQLRDRCGLGYPLLPDSGRGVARAYGVGGPSWLRRETGQTFLIGPQGVVAVHWPRADSAGHLADVLEGLRQQQTPA